MSLTVQNVIRHARKTENVFLPFFACFGHMTFKGITPMLQLIRRITADPDDNTKCSLIFANQVSCVFCCQVCRFFWGLLAIVAMLFFLLD